MGMELELNEQQYEKLLVMIQIGEWVINGIREEPLQEFEELSAKLYEGALSADLGHLVEENPSEEGVYPTREMEDWALSYLEEYADFVFWEQLAERLAQRDLIREYDEETIQEMEEELYMDKLEPLYNEYMDEFHEHGIERIELPV